MVETTYDDTCTWCKHTIKVYTLSWQTVKSRDSMPLVANYCNEKTCKDQKCKHDCEEVALSSPENEKLMLLEIVRRRRKLERLQETGAKDSKDQ